MSEDEYPRDHACPKCGAICAFTPRPDTQHYGAIRCIAHGYLWISRPKEDQKPRRKANKNLIGKLPELKQNFCWFCLREKQLLSLLNPVVALEVHHIVPIKDGGTDEQANLILLCAECHSEAHRRREAFERYKTLMGFGHILE
jgi:5-methylcytosine-specific restriction endonuclease McrA